jgi:hypothetical protein
VVSAHETPALPQRLTRAKFKVQDKEKGTWHGLGAQNACPVPAKIAIDELALDYTGNYSAIAPV